MRPAQTLSRRAIKVVGIFAIILVSASVVLASISFILKWGANGLGDGQFSTPGGIATDSTGNVYVAEGNGNRFQKFDNNGGFLMKAGHPGDNDGGFVHPA